MIDLTQFEGHTPGKWESNLYGDVLTIGPNYLYGIEKDLGSAKIKRQNARLIAAAPELLEELREARAEIARLRSILEAAP